MNRRGFVSSLLAVVATVALDVLPAFGAAEVPEHYLIQNPDFDGWISDEIITGLSTVGEDLYVFTPSTTYKLARPHKATFCTPTQVFGMSRSTYPDLTKC